MAHSHGHSCDGDHDHDETPELGVQYSLFSKIDLDNVECLNECEEGSGKLVFKPWEERLNQEKFVESDVDEELLFNIPFTGNIKLKGIILVGGDNGSHPSRMRIYKNRPHMTFDNTGLKPEQEFELQVDDNGVLEYSPAVVKFSSVYHLTLHFPSNFGSDTTKLLYIGLRGEYSQGHRHGVTICSYEARPNIADHKVDSLNHVSEHIQ